MAPIIPYELTRLRFRALHAEDLPRFYAYRSNPDVSRFQGWAPMTRAEARRFLDEQSGRERLETDAWTQLAIADRDSDELVGDLGIWLSADSSEAEFGLSLAPERQGGGLGTEAIRGIVEFLERCTPVKAVIAATDVRNRPCVAALDSAGLERIGTREGEYKGELCTEYVYRWYR